MAGFTDFTEAALLNHLFNDPAYTPPANIFVGLSSTTPTEAGGNFTEPSGGGYARVSTAAADWGAATGTAPVVKSNVNAITFAAATADWLAAVNLTNFGLFDALTGGNLLVIGTITTPKNVQNGDTASFGAGTLVTKLGDPGDTY